MNIIWSATAENQLKKHIQYIRKDSPQNAEKVKTDIAFMIAKILKYPEHFALEKNKANNDGSYRYFEKHRLRISYRVMPGLIWVVRVRHNSMKPKNL